MTSIRLMNAIQYEDADFQSFSTIESLRPILHVTSNNPFQF